MLKFIMGRSGSGKTSYVIDKIRESVTEGKQTYLLVPEQQAFISESMLADLPPSSALCFEVVSFSRLCSMVFAKYGGLTDSAASGGVRSLVMWQSLREIAPTLREYGRVKTDLSLSSMMLSTADELRASGITAEECEKAAEDCEDESLSRKLHDVALVYANYDRALATLAGEGALAAENKLSRMLNILREHKDFFKGSHVFVDSFTSFTGEEHAILHEIAKQADELSITLCRDKETKNMPHTVGIDETYIKLYKLAKDSGIETEIVTGESLKGKKRPALAALERGLWNFSLTSETIPSLPKDELDAIEAYTCKNEFDEINLAALKILEAYRGGTKFSEMALIFRDAESRKGLTEAVFEKMGIPFFISERTDLSSTAAARLLFSALRCVVFNFRAQDVITLLKTGLCGVDPADSDLFEDYCYTWSISGNKFLEDTWSMNPDGYSANKPGDRGRRILLAANRTRKKLIPPLVTLKNKFAVAKGDTLSNCRAIYEYLVEIGLSRALGDLAELDVATGDLRSAGESLRIYDAIVTAISETCTVLSDTQTTPEDLSYALEIMLRGSDVGSVPAVGEYVTVGSAPTLRVENVKLAIVMGLCEGEFPGNYSDSGIFTENDKKTMADALSISLSSREKRISSDELFFVYRAMTRPSEKLILSTYTSKIGGGSGTPSTAWNRFRFLFPSIEPVSFDFDLIKKISEAIREKDGEVSATDESLLNAVFADEKEIADSCDDAIDPALVKTLFASNVLYLSQTKISDFASCPYRYWCKYVLALREKKVSRVSYDSSGTLVHYVLEKLIGDIKNSDGSLSQPDDETVVRLVNGYVNEYIASIGCPLPPSMMYTFSRLRDLALVMAKSVLDEFASSDFKILAQELRISEKGENTLKPLEIKINEDEDSPRIILGGVIDRVDYFDGEDRRFIRVVDYKTGSHPFDVAGIESGEDVQLPAYLFTATKDENRNVIGGDKEIFPASALFLSANESGGKISPERSGFILNDAEVLRAASHELDKKILAGIEVYKTTGEATRGNAVSADEIKNIDIALRSSIVSTGRSIFEGKAPRTPSPSACKYCFLRSGCPVAAKSNKF